MLINPLDREAVRRRFLSAEPFPHLSIDNFLDAEFAERIAQSFPSLDEARKIGREFTAINERKKVQITDASRFAPAVSELNDLLASAEFLDFISYVTDIPKVIADEMLIGGGIHETGPRGHLDVHVDFNYIKDRGLHRRLNILIYFNKEWRPEWGGNIELWDRNVKVRHHSLSPIFNRCVLFETSAISYHGVSAVKCPDDTIRKSFAAYYYTTEAPAGWTGESHTTIFKARPDELVKGKVLMPFAKTMGAAKALARRARDTFRGGDV
jgi:Rps23 Pro-64 3,4-dihydroxylase Tpa1-like proline 4-hydroxylase